MAKLYEAEASPEKRLFISLITRDISLIDAIIDLTDNSVNAAMKRSSNPFASTKDFERYLRATQRNPLAHIDVKISDRKISVTDNAGGIEFESARSDTFKFGHAADGADARDRLSVYGIGMKRAIFKIGNKVKIISDHEDGGFALDLDVAAWEKKPPPWHFDIAKRVAASRPKCGTEIEVTELYSEVKRRVADGIFIDALRDKLSRVYSFFLGRLITLSVNGKPISATHFDVGDRFAHDGFEAADVSVGITVGIARSVSDNYKAENAGWYVFCNGRTVIYADKTNLTGWTGGGGASLPIFQPKHRPFLGLVFFVSEDPEALPWSTTKGTLNEDSLVWQQAKRLMITLGKEVIGVLDKRYGDSGTEIDRSEMAELAGRPTNAFSTASSTKRSFKIERRTPPAETKISYKAKESDIQKVRKHLGKPAMTAPAVGRHTFEYFLENEIDA
jgi:hypothetical protein